MAIGMYSTYTEALLPSMLRHDDISDIVSTDLDENAGRYVGQVWNSLVIWRRIRRILILLIQIRSGRTTDRQPASGSK